MRHPLRVDDVDDGASRPADLGVRHLEGSSRRAPDALQGGIPHSRYRDNNDTRLTHDQQLTDSEVKERVPF